MKSTSRKERKKMKNAIAILTLPLVFFAACGIISETDEQGGYNGQEFVSNADDVADISWTIISQNDRDSICLAYAVDPVGTLDSARVIWRQQGHNEKEVKALAKVVRKNC